MGARIGQPHRPAGTGNVKRSVDARGLVSFQGRVTRDGQLYWAKAVSCRKLPTGKRLTETPALPQYGLGRYLAGLRISEDGMVQGGRIVVRRTYGRGHHSLLAGPVTFMRAIERLVPVEDDRRV